jgi:hypothetical protein
MSYNITSDVLPALLTRVEKAHVAVGDLDGRPHRCLR